MAKAKEKISQREYGKRLGLSHNAVPEAIKANKIVKGVDEKGLIDPVIADKEWGNSARKRKASISDIKTSKYGEAAKDEADKILKLKITAEQIKTNMLVMDYKRKLGELVDKSVVNKELADYGQQIRMALEQLPVRIVDAVRAAGNRNDAIEVIEKAIRDELIKLTTITDNGLKVDG